MGFPEIVYDHVVTNPLRTFIKKEDFNELRKISSNGNESAFDGDINVDSVIKILETISKKMKIAPCNIEWNSNPNSWFFVNFFPTVYFVNESHKHNKKCVIPSLKTQELYLKHEPFIRIFSNSRTGCKITKIAKTHNFNMGKRFHYFGVTTKNNILQFGKKVKTKKNKSVKFNFVNSLKYDIKYLKKI